MILFTDSIYAIATAKTDAEKAAVEGCSGCKVLEIVDTPIGELGTRMGQLTTSLLAKYGDAWTYSIGVNDLYFDFAVPSLVSAGIDPAEGYPRQIAAGDGSVPAFQRIREKQYQVATVAEPLHLHGWQTIDELNAPLPASLRATMSRRRTCSSTPTSTPMAATRISSTPATAIRTRIRRSGANRPSGSTRKRRLGAASVPSPRIFHDVEPGAAPVGAITEPVRVDEHVRRVQHHRSVRARVDELFGAGGTHAPTSIGRSGSRMS